MCTGLKSNIFESQLDKIKQDTISSCPYFYLTNVDNEPNGSTSSIYVLCVSRRITTIPSKNIL